MNEVTTDIQKDELLSLRALVELLRSERDGLLRVTAILVQRSGGKVHISQEEQVLSNGVVQVEQDAELRGWWIRTAEAVETGEESE